MKNIDNPKNISPEVTHTPIEKGLKTINDIFESSQKLLKAATFISTVNLNCKLSEYNLSSQNRFFYQAWGKTFLVAKQKDKLKIKLVANFIVKDVKERTLIYNDKSGKKTLKDYVVTLENSNGKLEKDVEVA